MLLFLERDLSGMILLEYFYSQLAKANQHHAVPLFANGFAALEETLCQRLKQSPREIAQSVLAQYEKLLITHGGLNLDTPTATSIANKYHKILLAEAQRILGSSGAILKFYPSLKVINNVSLDDFSQHLAMVFTENLKRAMQNPDKIIQEIQQILNSRSAEQKDLTLTLQKNFRKVITDIAKEKAGQILLRCATKRAVKQKGMPIIVAAGSHVGDIRQAFFKVTANGVFAMRSGMMAISGFHFPNDPLLIAQPPAANMLGDKGRILPKQVFEDELMHLVTSIITNPTGERRLGNTMLYPVPENDLVMQKVFFTAAESDQATVRQLANPNSQIYQDAGKLLKEHLLKVPPKQYVSMAYDPKDTGMLPKFYANKGKKISFPIDTKRTLTGHVRDIRYDAADCGGNSIVSVLIEVANVPTNKLDLATQMDILYQQAEVNLFLDYPVEKRSVEMLNKLSRMVDIYGHAITQLLFPKMTHYFSQVFLPMVSEHNQNVFWDHLSVAATSASLSPSHSKVRRA